MLRGLILLLVLANGLLLALRQGWLGDGQGAGTAAEREPQRVTHQVNPGMVRVVPQSAASAEVAAALAVAASREAAASASAAAARDRLCLQAGPFSAPDAAVAERTLREAGVPAAAWHPLTQEDSGAFMIYMGRYTDPELYHRKQAELGRMHVPAQPIPSGSPLAPGLDLGRFDLRAQAEADLLRLNGRGVRSARVMVLRAEQTVTMLRVPAADAALRAQLAGLKLPAGPGFMPCGDASGTPPTAASAPALEAPAAVPPGATSAPAAQRTPGAVSGPPQTPPGLPPAPAQR